MNPLKYYELEVKEQISSVFSKVLEIRKEKPYSSKSNSYIDVILKKLLFIYSSFQSKISSHPKETQKKFIQHIEIYIQIQFSENQLFYNDLFQYLRNTFIDQPNTLLNSLKTLNQVSLLRELVKDYILFDISNQYSQINFKNCESLLKQITLKVEKQYLKHFILIADIIDMRMILENEIKSYINNLLVKNIYLVIIHYPDTICYLHDIYKTIKREEDVYNRISNELSNNITTKLLRKDNTTMFILQIYVNIIKSLHIIDKNDIIINKSINDLIKKYLRNRKDTIQCIIENITDPNMSNIFIMDNYDDDSKGFSNDNEWNPELRELNNNHMKMNTNDLLRIFVNIFGNENDFMNEYHMLLCKRLLLHHSNIQQEIEIVKELHRLFNHSLLKSFDVMLNDIIESKKINKEITMNDPFPINSLILSHYYWPDMKSYNIKWHKSVKPYIQKFMINYNDKFSPSIFQWYIFEGKVTFDLTIGDTTKEFELSPILFNILLYFGDKDEWELNELSEIIHLDVEAMKNCLSKLISYGIIELNSKTSQYSVVKELNSNFEENEVDEVEEDDEEDVEKTNKRVLETYIKMILNNIGKSPIEKIHKMLQVFIVGQNKYEKTIDELYNILNELCVRKELELENGLYTALKIV